MMRSIATIGTGDFSMLQDQTIIEQLIETSVSFDHIESDVNESVPDYSYWRLLPFSVICCPIKGEIHFELESGEKKVIGPGQTLLVPPNVNHKFEMKNGMVTYVHVHYKIFEQVDLLSLFSTPNVIIGESCQHIIELITKANQTIKERKENLINLKEIIKIKAAFLNLLELILDQSQIRSEALHFIVNFQKISPVIKYIDENIHASISRDDMAKVISLSPTRFHYVFTEIMGTSPVSYLKKLRLQKAQQLLISTDIPISDIAERVGFRDIFHFSKQFKSAFGVSPSKYKENVLFSMFKIE